MQATAPAISRAARGLLKPLPRTSELHEEPVRRVVARIEQIGPDWVHAMHGGTLTGEVLPRYAHALREERFAFEGKLMGRELPQAEPAPTGA
jgi:hypothetical protein